MSRARNDRTWHSLPKHFGNQGSKVVQGLALMLSLLITTNDYRLCFVVASQFLCRSVHRVPDSLGLHLTLCAPAHLPLSSFSTLPQCSSPPSFCLYHLFFPRRSKRLRCHTFVQLILHLIHLIILTVPLHHHLLNLQLPVLLLTSPTHRYAQNNLLYIQSFSQVLRNDSREFHHL